MSDKLHVLFLSMHYRPEPCDTRTSQLAKALAAKGHRATALTSFPNYPFGKIYPGYKQKLVQKSVDDGVELVRVPMFPDHSMSKKRRALSYLSFGFSAAFLGAIFTKRPDIIWIHHPPLTTGIAGWMLAKLKRVPFIYEIHDLWPETLMSTGMIREGRVTRAIRRVCAFLQKRADAIVVTSDGMKDHLERQCIPREKLFVFPQWADEAIYKPIERNPEIGKQHGLAGKFNVFFTGNIGVAQGLDTLLDAAKRLRNEPQIQIVLVGAGVELARLQKRVQEEAIDNVRFLGQFAPQEMPGLFAWADATLLHLLHDPLFAITVPSKLQTYLAMAKPILCGVGGDASKIVEQADAGLTFPPEEVFGMAQAIKICAESNPERRSEWSANAGRFYESHFSQTALASRYEVLFHSILEQRRARKVRAVVVSGTTLEVGEISREAAS